MIKIIRDLLEKIISNIDSGNSNLTENEAIELTKILQSYTDRTIRMSKYQACQYLNVSRATFDNYVRDGKLPKGKHEAGFKELSWDRKILDKFIEENKTKGKYDNSKKN